MPRKPARKLIRKIRKADRRSVFPYRRAAVLGVGLLGGSLARALRKRRLARSLVGWDPDLRARAAARTLLQVVPSPELAVRGSDLVLVAAPPSRVGGLLRRIAPHVAPGCLVLDVASLKVPVARAAVRIPGARGWFVPCHPMAGREKSGARHADPDLFRGRTAFLCPLPGGAAAMAAQAEAFWRRLGARPYRLSAATHDRLVARTSHLPHLVAATLMERYGAGKSRDPRYALAVGSGLKDATRTAEGDSALWADILSGNARHLCAESAALRRSLAAFEAVLARRTPSALRRRLERARRLRTGLPS